MGASYTQLVVHSAHEMLRHQEHNTDFHEVQHFTEALLFVQQTCQYYSS